MLLLIAALGVLLAGGVLSLVCSRDLRLSTRLGSGAAILAGLLGLAGTVHWLSAAGTGEVRWPWHVPYGEFHLGIDPLSAVFLLAIFGLTVLAALYGAPYLLRGHDKRAGASWFFFDLLVASMALLVLARNGVLFLSAWELMALASFFLVTWEHERPEVRAAGLTYLLAAHLGTAFLFAFFAILGQRAGTLDFTQFAALAPLSSGLAGTLFVLAVVGFGVKAGLMPFHVWLPEAHAAAPSHVSALMSGVMIKTGIYGVLRALTFLGPAPAWWGLLLIVVGAASAVLGVLYALAQQDLKRLLAYSSIENIGIITLGIGVGVWGLSQGNQVMATLGFAGALLHVLNHAVFKGLLFMGAGAILHATGERELERLGGLLRRMPITGLTFFVAAAAISGLPPLNGFISEFVILLGALSGVVAQKVATVAVLSAVLVALAFAGPLAAAAFLKASGIAFLGHPRSAAAATAKEPERELLLPLAVLATLCAVMGLGGIALIHLLIPATAQLAHVTRAAATAQLVPFTGPLGKALIVSLTLLGLAAGLALLRYSLLAGRSVRSAVTWDCGYEQPSARMQYSAASFSQPLTTLARGLLWARERVVGPQGYFPRIASFESKTPDLWTERLYGPLLRAVDWSGARLRWLQQGRLAIYLLYIFATLVVLLVWKLRFA